MSNPPGNTYELNDYIQLSNTFTDVVTGDVVDPTTVILYIQDPTGTETGPFTGGQLVRVGPGIYQYVLLADISGTWIYKWQGAGNVQVTSPDTYFLVRQSAVLAG